MPRKRKISDKPDQPVEGGNGVAGDDSAAPTPVRKKRAPRKATKSAALEATPPQISDEAIRLRAYFIAEERARRGMPADEHSDWLEARRQLMAELG